jgi:hypothetical protein
MTNSSDVENLAKATLPETGHAAMASPAGITPDPAFAPPSQPQRSQGADRLARFLALSALLVTAGLGGYGHWLSKTFEQKLYVRPSIPFPTSEPAPELLSRLNALETELAALKAQSKTAASQISAPQEIPQEMPQASNQPTEDTTLFKDQLSAAVGEIADLKQQLAEITASKAETQDLSQQVTQLRTELNVANSAISGIEGHVQKATQSAQQATQAETSVRAHLIAYMDLRAAAELAAPFVPQWENFCTATQTLAKLAPTCAKLENAARGGVATLQMLQARFAIMAPAAEQALAMANAKNWWERVKASLDQVVRVRMLDPDRNDKSAARQVHDAAAALQRGDLVSSLEKVKSLPSVAQDELREWVQDAQARLELDASIIKIGKSLATINGEVAIPSPTPAAAALPETTNETINESSP